MHYTDLQKVSPAEFKRLCGVTRETFGEMVTLEYWREYRSQFHLATTWRLHETTVGRTIKKVEELLVKRGKFWLPSKHQMYQASWKWKVVVVDVGEMEIERHFLSNLQQLLALML